MKTTAFSLLLLPALALSSAASATCYQIFAPNNELVWQKMTAPVPMDSPSVSDEVRKLVPGGHLVIVDDRTAPCPELDSIKRKTMRERVQEINELRQQ